MYEQVTRSIRQPDGVEPIEWRKISAAWAVDEDISRLLKSLPNWMTLVIEPYHALSTPSSMLTSPPSTTPMTMAAESADDIRRRNERESEILIGNLGMQKKIETWEMITESTHIRSLANMNESIEWFSTRVRATIAQLPKLVQDQLRTAKVQVTIDGVCEQHETLSGGLERRLQQLDDMSGTCLLILHLEVRVHLFHHLLPLARLSNHVVGAWQSQEADAQVRVTEFSALMKIRSPKGLSGVRRNFRRPTEVEASDQNYITLFLL